MVKKKSNDTLEGFDKLMEEFLENEGRENKRKSKISDIKSDSYKSYNYLELERDRIQKLRSLLSGKIPNVVAHNQADELVGKFTAYNFNLTHDIVEELIKFDSIFNKNIRQLFNKAFRDK